MIIYASGDTGEVRAEDQAEHDRIIEAVRSALADRERGSASANSLVA